MNGDLTPSYKHQGYKGTLEGRRVTSKLSDLTTAQHWIDNALHVIKQVAISTYISISNVLNTKGNGWFNIPI